MTVENFTPQAFPASKRFLKFSVFHKWIKNLCLIPDGVPWAGQWKGLPWATGIPDEWVPGLRRHCGATGTARNPAACKAVQNLFYYDAALLNGPVSCRKKDKEHLHKDPFDKYPGWSPWVHWSRDAYLYGLWSDRSWILRKDRLTQFLQHAECIPNRIRRRMVGYSDMDTMKIDADSWCMIASIIGWDNAPADIPLETSRQTTSCFSGEEEPAILLERANPFFRNCRIW